MKKSKKIILPVIAMTSIALSSLAFANTTSPHRNTLSGGININTSSSGSIVAAINNVGKNMVAVGYAGLQAFDNAMYQVDVNLLGTLATSRAGSTITSQVSKNAEVATADFIKNRFQILPNQILDINGEGGKKIAAEIKNQAQLTKTMKLDIPASDTLYSNDPLVTQRGAPGKPKENDDNYFSISSVLAPTTYTTAQKKAALYYMRYLTKSYDNNSPKNQINLEGLLTKQTSNATKATILKAIHNGTGALGEAYKTYQLALRSDMAMKSIGVNSFNRMIAERTPSTKTVPGIKDRNGKVITHPSPLQIQNYIANHRIDNPAWIKGLQSKSSTALLRELVIMQARTLQQNNQAHLDNEHLIALLAAQQLQSSNGNQIFLGMKIKALNTAIVGAGGTKLAP